MITTGGPSVKNFFARRILKYRMDQLGIKKEGKEEEEETPAGK